MARRRRRIAAAAAGAAAGVAAAAGVLAATSRAVGTRAAVAPERVEATHLPPLLRPAGEPVTLRYDVYCVGSAEPPATCDAGGTVYVRPDGAGSFQAFPLALDPGAVEGRYAARVPDALASVGFSYYAVLRDRRSGVSTMLPVGAPAALERSIALGSSTLVVPLGAHVFGSTLIADARVASARWGDGLGEVGLEEQGPDATPIGASAFDVDASGRVTVLDEAHRRLLRWAPGVSSPQAVPVAIAGTIADIASGRRGTTYVLETAGHGAGAVLRTFAPGGDERSAIDVGWQAAAVQTAAGGPVVLEPQSGRWLAAGASPSGIGRPVDGGLHVVVDRAAADEVRVAMTTESGAVVRAWRIQSETPLAEVQLAQPLADRLVVVLRVYDDSHAEFAVLVLGAHGLERQFSLEAADWAETAPFGRFRLAGGALYRLGSTPAGIFVDRFDLGVS